MAVPRVSDLASGVTRSGLFVSTLAEGCSVRSDAVCRIEVSQTRNLALQPGLRHLTSVNLGRKVSRHSDWMLDSSRMPAAHFESVPRVPRAN